MLNVQSMNVCYGKKRIVNDFSLDIHEGEIVSLIGPNGSGKSTVLKAISRLIPCESGSVRIAGEPADNMSMKQLSRIMCMLCQSNSCPSDVTVEELVGYGRVPHKKWYERLDAADYEIVDWALQQTGLESYRGRYLASLSGGEAQRAWIAMALAQKPKLLLLDEPTTYLDIAHQLDVLELIAKLNRELKLTVVMVLHDLNHASTYSDKICVIKDGDIRVFGKPQDVFTLELIRSVYGVDTEIRYAPDSTSPRIHVLKKAQ
ncbi:iron ABC transporter ATP-binding protein [Brevibacillus agri]|uniref:ABC transporter ATP-binding protein n=1 Tax=Brevibacillus agri TaxID=51101 RepID=A0A3M8AW28_9BACL|nr:MULTISPECIES: ABC transporter ATP-binding protein [Brevibacillus]ELK39344.1 iron compound ABC transporter ATP-binding protein FhuC [Brevibacillus agri BAB-2500]EJL43545.1 ABC-type cobalamin/Fe3+-siderophore transport system, ATPase component [Brevibacillus sp. CF112]MBG9567206.1 iron ABC transporter ATP-binding protein [Brevibacillus agri]MBY0050963.1 ABC transporter ATP-binding protein [Brevibacillus agri]MDN4093683.1 ABC transporter ATP-binding protein [Brevibacillus agri]